MIDGGLRRLFMERLPHIHWQAIETGMTGRGIPDVNYCAGGVEGWLEYKQTGGWAVAMRPEQIGWLARRARAGGRVWVAVRRRNALDDQLWLIRGHCAGALRVNGLRGVLGTGGVVGVWEGGPAAWAWCEIERWLLG